MIRITGVVLIGTIVAVNAFAGGAGNTNNLASRFVNENTVEEMSSGDEPEVAAISSRSFSRQSFSFKTLSSVDDVDICAVNPTSVLNPVGPSLVLNNPVVLKSGFSFSRTINQIVSTSPSQSTVADNIIGSMIDTYSDAEKLNVDSDVTMPLDVRTGELSLVPSDLLTDMQPTAIFNRLDLAPSDGSNCGEYRMVYHHNSGHNVRGRFFIIFEAQYPNPTPSLGLAGCLPVVDFWVSLNDKSEDEAALALEKFFYEGIAQNEVHLPAVVNFNNYSSGQVRVNNFISPGNWQLREFKTALSNENAIFDLVTVKSNPLTELYSAFSGSDENALNLSSEFKADFNIEYINQLLNPEIIGVNDNVIALINTISLNSENKYNEFQSTAQGNTDNPASKISPVFMSEIGTTLSTNENPEVQVITSEMLVNRAGAMTCGGCHQFSNNDLVAPGVAWPSSGGFVHVSENGRLSPALTDSFLPFRAKILTDVACNRPDPKPVFGAWLIPVWNITLN